MRRRRVRCPCCSRDAGARRLREHPGGVDAARGARRPAAGDGRRPSSRRPATSTPFDLVREFVRRSGNPEAARMYLTEQRPAPTGRRRQAVHHPRHLRHAAAAETTTASGEGQGGAERHPRHRRAAGDADRQARPRLRVRPGHRQRRVPRRRAPRGRAVAHRRAAARRVRAAGRLQRPATARSPSTSSTRTCGSPSPTCGTCPRSRPADCRPG